MVTRHALARNAEWRQISTWLASCGMPDFCIYFVVSTTSFIHRHYPSWVHLPANIAPTWEKPVDTCVSTLMFDIARGNENQRIEFRVERVLRPESFDIRKPERPGVRNSIKPGGWYLGSQTLASSKAALRPREWNLCCHPHPRGLGEIRCETHPCAQLQKYHGRAQIAVRNSNVTPSSSACHELAMAVDLAGGN
jgi:hypothetical protein